MNTEISSPPCAKTAANPSGVCHQLYQFTIEVIILGKFITSALDSAVSTEEPCILDGLTMAALQQPMGLQSIF